jgi:hypothetical protein
MNDGRTRILIIIRRMVPIRNNGDTVETLKYNTCNVQDLHYS